MNAFPLTPMRVVVETEPGVYALGNFKYSTIDGRYVVHIDGECAEHDWDSDQVEFLEEDGELN